VALQDRPSAVKRENEIKSRKKKSTLKILLERPASDGGKVASSILVVPAKYQKRLEIFQPFLIFPGHFLLLFLHRVKCPIACGVVVIPAEPVLDLDRGAGILYETSCCQGAFG
jgi:hypothetical protein